jgi:hypothetical protein
MKYSDIWAKPVHTSATAFMRPAPLEFNEDLDRPTATSPIPEREQHAYLLRHTAVEPVEQPLCATLPRQTVVAAVVVHTSHGRRSVGPAAWTAATGPTSLGALARSTTTGRRTAASSSSPDRLPRSGFGGRSPKTDAGCWMWTRCTTAGYGRFAIAHQSVPAQRFAWELVIGPIPRGMELGHRNACPHHCVNPDHWAPATDQQNAIYSAVHPSPTDRRWRTTQRLCVIDGCDHKHVARGVCAKHVDQRS